MCRSSILFPCESILLTSSSPSRDSKCCSQSKKRKEIEEKVAALKLAKAKEEEQKTNFFGDHVGITCDGCGASPIVGYRYRCKSCANHDVSPFLQIPRLISRGLILWPSLSLCPVCPNPRSFA